MKQIKFDILSSANNSPHTESLPSDIRSVPPKVAAAPSVGTERIITVTYPVNNKNFGENSIVVSDNDE